MAGGIWDAALGSSGGAELDATAAIPCFIKTPMLCDSSGNKDFGKRVGRERVVVGIKVHLHDPDGSVHRNRLVPQTLDFCLSPRCSQQAPYPLYSHDKPLKTKRG